MYLLIDFLLYETKDSKSYNLNYVKNIYTAHNYKSHYISALCLWPSSQFNQFINTHTRTHSHTLMLADFSSQMVYILHSCARWPAAPLLEWLLTVWGCVCLFWQLQSRYIMCWEGKKGVRQPDRESLNWHWLRTKKKKKWSGKEKLWFPWCLAFGGAVGGLHQSVCVCIVTRRMWCMECESCLRRLLDWERQAARKKNK